MLNFLSGSYFDGNMALAFYKLNADPKSMMYPQKIYQNHNQLLLHQLSYRSKIHACPKPPSAHAATSANLWFSSCSRRDAVVTNLDPVAPKGCPSANDPPLVFILLKSTSPNFFPPNFSSANFCEFIATRLERICPANASWISKTPMSDSRSRLLRIRTSCEQYVGPCHFCSCKSSTTKWENIVTTKMNVTKAHDKSYQ